MANLFRLDIGIAISDMRFQIITLTTALLCIGCLEFGTDVETQSPSEEQLAFCVSAMHLNSSLEYTPVGLKIIGSGIDDAAWFMFTTPETNPAMLFDSCFIPADSLFGRVSFYSPENMPQWWDAGNRTFSGGSIPIEFGRHITAGYRFEEDRMVVYIFWNET